MSLSLCGHTTAARGTRNARRRMDVASAFHRLPSQAMWFAQFASHVWTDLIAIAQQVLQGQELVDQELEIHL